MATLVVPPQYRRPRQKPSGEHTLNRASPLARGLIRAYTFSGTPQDFSHRELVTGNRLAVSGNSPSWAINNEGIFPHMVKPIDGEYLVSDSYDPGIGAGDFSIFWQGRFLINGSSSWEAVFAHGGYSPHLFVNNSTGNAWGVYLGATELANTDLDGGAYDNVLTSLCAVRRSGVIYFYLNGVADGSQANVASYSGTDTDRWNGLSATGAADWSEPHVTLVYGRALSPGEQLALHNDPFQIVAQRDPIIIPLSSGGTEINLTSASYSIAGQTLGTNFETNISLTSASYSIAGQTITLNLGTTIDLTAGSFSIAGQSLETNFGTGITLTSGPISISGQPLTLSAGTDITLTNASISIAGQPVGVASAATINLTAGTMSISGQAMSVSGSGLENLYAGLRLNIGRLIRK